MFLATCNVHLWVIQKKSAFAEKSVWRHTAEKSICSKNAGKTHRDSIKRKQSLQQYTSPSSTVSHDNQNQTMSSISKCLGNVLDHIPRPWLLQSQAMISGFTQIKLNGGGFVCIGTDPKLENSVRERSHLVLLFLQFGIGRWHHCLQRDGKLHPFCYYASRTTRGCSSLPAMCIYESYTMKRAFAEKGIWRHTAEKSICSKNAGKSHRHA